MSFRRTLALLAVALTACAQSVRDQWDDDLSPGDRRMICIVYRDAPGAIGGAAADAGLSRDELGDLIDVLNIECPRIAP